MATNTNPTNPHSPGKVDPAQYDYVANFYRGGSEAMQDAYQGDHLEIADRFGSDWADRALFHPNGGCTSCGSHYSHGALLVYKPTGQLVTVGHTCGETFGLPDKAARDLRRTKAAADKIAQRLAARELLADQVRSTPGLGFALTQNHRIIRDMVDRGRPLSERQVEFALSLANEVVDAAYERLVNPADAPLADVPVPETTGRVEIVGEVLAVKWQESNYGGSLKMLVEVEHDGGAYRLWGSVPSAIDPETGDRVSFTAKVERSSRDESFGFFKRPTKAELVEVAR